MDRAKIASTFKVLVAKQLSIDQSEILETSSFSDLGADSLDMTEVTMAAEKEFQIEVEDISALADIQTVGQAVDFIFNKRR